MKSSTHRSTFTHSPRHISRLTHIQPNPLKWPLIYSSKTHKRAQQSTGNLSTRKCNLYKPAKGTVTGSNNRTAIISTKTRDHPFLCKIHSQKKAAKPACKFLYYISEVKKDIENQKNQNQGLFLSHIIVSMCVRKSHRFTFADCPLTKVLVPNIRNCGSGDRKIIIFDLDETLAHTISQGQLSTLPSGIQYRNCYKIKIKLENNEGLSKNNSPGNLRTKILQQNYGGVGQVFEEKIGQILQPFQEQKTVNKHRMHIELMVNVRPYAKQVLERLAGRFTLGIFTASEANYAQEIVRLLDPRQDLFSFILDRRHCRQIESYSSVKACQNIKDLRILDGYDPSKTVLVDNSCISYLLQPENGIPIIPFVGDPEDDQLLKLEQFMLSTILPCRDVRPAIIKCFRTPDYDKFSNVKTLVEKIVRSNGQV